MEALLSAEVECLRAVDTTEKAAAMMLRALNRIKRCLQKQEFLSARVWPFLQQR